MKAALNWKRHRYVTTVGIFLIVVALIAGMVGCSPTGYNLTMTVAPASAGTATDLTNASPYAEGTAVSIKAVANVGYQFVSWSAPTGTFAAANAAETTFTMPGQGVIVTANFAVEIWDWNDLDAIRDNLGVTYYLMNDLDSTSAGYTELASPTANGGKGWQPIGNWHEPGEAFNGTFDGQGYEIKNLFMNRPGESCVGLFCLVSSEAVIKNVGMVNADVTGNHSVGGLVGDNEGGTISYCYSNANVTGEYVVGGLVGGNFGPVSDCYSTGSVTGGDLVGGLVGYSDLDGTVSDSYSAGNVTGGDSVGGLVGGNFGPVSDCYSSANVTGEYSAGGLVGYNTNPGPVSNCYSTGGVADGYDVGGLVGWNDGGTVSDSFWDTETSGQSTSDGGTGKTTEEMQDLTSFSGATWDIIAVANPSTRNTSYIWNIVDDTTYPFLSWEPVS